MNIIKFKRDTAFRDTLFTEGSFAHPAKMDDQLLIWMIEKFTKPGETILDPMFGSGTTMLACILGRNVIGVELEPKFIDMAKANWEKVKQKPQLGYSMGDCQILQGDARNLSGLLADSIITSPPYAEGLASEGRGIDLSKTKRDGDIRHQSLGHLTYGVGFGKNPDNIGGLPYGSIDSVISSPPYSESKVPPHTKEGEELRLKIAKERGVSPDKVSYMDYTKKVDHIITSPPYEGIEIAPSGSQAPRKIRKQRLEKIDDHYNSENQINIGNLKSASYLEAMLIVYQECYKVLKPQGLMVLVTKNFIRHQKEMRLDSDTIKLCETAGFTFQERWYRELPAQSFWRIIYKKKHPSAPELKYEDILVFRKD